jgi:hypothetical protein
LISQLKIKYLRKIMEDQPINEEERASELVVWGSKCYFILILMSR